MVADITLQHTLIWDIPTAAGTEREADPGHVPMEIGLARKISHAPIKGSIIFLTRKKMLSREELTI